ncbi:MAG TPA: GldG family protein [Polyangia bacterium]|nr:GldG family protein [Polyangia bacterium]
MASEQDNEKESGPAAPAADSPEKKMGRQKLASASNASAYVLLAVGAVVLVNLIGTRLFGRLDLTENHVYTLAPGSKDIVAKLPDYLTVKAYISSKDLPPELKPVSSYVRDLLDDYKTYSKGKLRFEVYDPGDDKKIEEDAGQCKVQKLQVQVMRSQKFEVGAYYLGLCFQYQGKDEAIPQVTQVEGLEYRISSLLKRMTQKKQKIAITNGHGESELAYLKHIEEFEVTNVNPSSAPIPDDVDALIVAGPKQPFDDKGRHELDAFLMKGKGVIFMVDGMAMQQPRGNMPPEMQGAAPKIGQANDTGLNELLEKYGFKIGADFVLDQPKVPGPIDLPDGRKMLANVPVYVGVKTNVDDKDLSLMDHIGALVFPFPSSVELVGPLAGGKPAAGKLWTIAKTTPTAWKATGMFFFSPTTKIEEGKEKGAYGLAYAYQGPLKSAYPSPAAQAGMSSPDQAGQPPSESKKPVRLLVIGDSDFASEEYLQIGRYIPVYQEGPQMLLNAMGWATEDEALTPVRTKTLTARPIEVPGSAFAWQVVNIAGVPIAFVMFGVLRWRLRRARRTGLKL